MIFQECIYSCLEFLELIFHSVGTVGKYVNNNKEDKKKVFSGKNKVFQ